MGFVEFVGWVVIFYALFTLAFYEPGLTLMLLFLSFFVGLALLPFVVLGLALDKGDKE
jgi:hypothetical protein